MADVLIETYGCTLNQADSDIMANLLSRAGHKVEESGIGERKDKEIGKYDIIIVNTCTVKKPTEQKIMHRLKQLRGVGKRLIVAGCLASASPQEVRQAVPEASIIGTQHISEIVDVAEEALEGKSSTRLGLQILDKLAYFAPSQGVIARIPIAEGCLSSCTFCETRYARGPLNSFSKELVLKAISMSLEKGAKELELTAQDTGVYGLDKNTNIAELLSEAAELNGEFMIRLGMLNPEHLHRYFDALIEAYRKEKVYKFIHLPLQSGSDAVLRHMKRNYTFDEYKAYVKELRSKVPGISIETDMIVGYPTETNDDFEQSMQALQEIKPEVTNVSKFGPRPHAPASRLKGISNIEIKRRSVEMSRLARAIQYEARKKLVGTTQRVLVTEQSSRSMMGRTTAYIAAVLNEQVPLGSFVSIRALANTSTCIIGKLERPLA